MLSWYITRLPVSWFVRFYFKMLFERGYTHFIQVLIILNSLGVNKQCNMQEKVTRCPNYDNMEPTTSIGFTVNEDSDILCLRACLNGGLTRSVFYNSATKVCQCADLPPLSLGLQDQSGVECMEVYGFTETWASSVINVSSEYVGIAGDTRFSATQLLGAPNVYPAYGDIKGTWTFNDTDNYPWIEVAIPEPMFLDHLYIYETYHAGGVETISVRDTQDSWHVLWTTPGIQVITKSRIFEPDFKSTLYKINGLRLEVGVSGNRVWVELDSVRFVGRM